MFSILLGIQLKVDLVGEMVIMFTSHLFILGFTSIALGDWPKKTLLWFMSENILPMLSCRSIMVSWIIFKSKKMTLKYRLLQETKKDTT